jgi:hypothetical protein
MMLLQMRRPPSLGQRAQPACAWSKAGSKTLRAGLLQYNAAIEELTALIEGNEQQPFGRRRRPCDALIGPWQCWSCSKIDAIAVYA